MNEMPVKLRQLQYFSCIKTMETCESTPMTSTSNHSTCLSIPRIYAWCTSLRNVIKFRGYSHTIYYMTKCNQHILLFYSRHCGRIDRWNACWYKRSGSSSSTQLLPWFLRKVYSIHLTSLQWRHNGRDGVLHHQPHDCLLNRLFRHRSKKTSNIRVTGLCAGNSPVTGEFSTQMASNAENVSIWWRHHGEFSPCRVKIALNCL